MTHESESKKYSSDSKINIVILHAGGSSHNLAQYSCVRQKYTMLAYDCELSLPRIETDYYFIRSIDYYHTSTLER